MDALVASPLEGYNIDLDRVYIWGLSGGAVFIERARQCVRHNAEGRPLSRECHEQWTEVMGSERLAGAPLEVAG